MRPTSYAASGLLAIALLAMHGATARASPVGKFLVIREMVPRMYYIDENGKIATDESLLGRWLDRNLWYHSVAYCPEKKLVSLMASDKKGRSSQLIVLGSAKPKIIYEKKEAFLEHSWDLTCEKVAIYSATESGPTITIVSSKGSVIKKIGLPGSETDYRLPKQGWLLDGKSLIMKRGSTAQNSNVARLDIETGSLETVIGGNQPLALSPAVFTERGRAYIVYTAVDRIIMFDLAAGQDRVIRQYPLKQRVLSLQVSPGGDALLYQLAEPKGGDPQLRLVVHELSSGKETILPDIGMEFSAIE